MPFDISHDDAFTQLGAIEPGQHWSSFDVSMLQARKGNAKLLVTSIWNYHSFINEDGRRVPTVLAICQDKATGALWYQVNRPQVGATNKNWVAHWNRICLSIDTHIPIVGVLKDVATRKCSLESVFDCHLAKEQSDGLALWLQLIPRGIVEAKVRLIDINALTTDTRNTQRESFEQLLNEAMRRTPEERLARLAHAPRLPNTKTIITKVFVRNPDVVAEALYRANGTCEDCHNAAPFLRHSDKSPYLEVHHRTPLSAGGEDTLENAVALCPNCHRRAHYG
jgi:hypothetical protein